MQAAYKKLCVDHAQLQRLLRCMRGISLPLQQQGLDPERLALMMDAIDYIRVYPERWHHPLEDQLFARLLEKDIPEAELVEQVVVEHGTLEKLTSQLDQHLSSVANGNVVPMPELRKSVDDYVLAQADHIEKENLWVYPLFDRYLKDEDWYDIEEQLSQAQDPLFGDLVKSDYHNLFQSIIVGEKDLLAVNY